MLIYLDMCCLKRPFDDQSQARIRLEAEAVLTLLSRESDEFRFVHSRALMLENSFNPIRERAARVEAWLTSQPLWIHADDAAFSTSMQMLTGLGLKSFDALHVASAIAAKADYFVSVDDRLIAVARKHADLIPTRVRSIVECAQEVLR